MSWNGRAQVPSESPAQGWKRVRRNSKGGIAATLATTEPGPSIPVTVNRPGMAPSVSLEPCTGGHQESLQDEHSLRRLTDLVTVRG